MSYVQGTVILVRVATQNPDTLDAVDPTDMIVKVLKPDTTSYTLQYSTGGIIKDAVGKYHFSIDTSPVAGNWKYQVDATGADAIVKQRQLRVTPRMT